MSNKKSLGILVGYIIVCVIVAWISSKIAFHETHRQQEVLAEIQSLKLERMPPTPEQLLLLRAIHKLENLEYRVDKIAVVASSNNKILRVAKDTAAVTPKFDGKKSIAIKPRPTFKATSPKTHAQPQIDGTPDMWSKQAEENRKKWNAWADRELEKLRKNN